MLFLNEINNGESMLDRALALWELGFHIFPLGSPLETPPDYFSKRFGTLEEAERQWPKTPRIAWAEYQTRPPTEDEVRNWWTKWPNANIAIVTGIQIDVIDADSDEAAEWCRSGALTRTPWENHTGRGVQFIYRRGPHDVRNTANPGTKIDTRGVGGYIVAPGSLHANGKRYELVVDESYAADGPDELPALHQGDLVALGAYRPESAAPHEYVIDDDDDWSVDASNAKLPLDDLPTTEGGRNNKAAALAGKYINDGDDFQTALARLREWNRHNQPPLPDEELTRTLKSVVKTHQRNNPDRPVNPAPTPVSSDGGDPNKLRILNIGDLMDNPPDKPEFLWGGPALFKGARVMVVGQPKTGKSRFLQSLFAALATGQPFLGEEVKRPLKTLWLNAEVHQAWLPDRLNAIARSTPPALLPLLRENFLMTGRIRLDINNPIHFQVIKNIILKEGVDIVGFDPMINFSSANENDNTEMRATLDNFDRLQAETGVTIVLVHHSRKGSKQFDKDPFDTIRGASALRGWYDTGIVLAPVDGMPGTVSIAWELRNGEPRSSHAAQFNEATGMFEMFGFADVEEGEVHEAMQPRAMQIFAFLGEEIGAWFSTKDLREKFMAEFDCSDRSFRNYMSEVKAHPSVEEEGAKFDPTGVRIRRKW